MFSEVEKLLHARSPTKIRCAICPYLGRTHLSPVMGGLSPVSGGSTPRASRANLLGTFLPVVLSDCWYFKNSCYPSRAARFLCFFFPRRFFVLCWYVICCVVLICSVLSCPVLSCPVLSCCVLLCPVVSCSVLSCYVLSCPGVSCWSVLLVVWCSLPSRTSRVPTRG